MKLINQGLSLWNLMLFNIYSTNVYHKLLFAKHSGVLGEVSLSPSCPLWLTPFLCFFCSFLLSFLYLSNYEKNLSYMLTKTDHLDNWRCWRHRRNLEWFMKQRKQKIKNEAPLTLVRRKNPFWVVSGEKEGWGSVKYNQVARSWGKLATNFCEAMTEFMFWKRHWKRYLASWRKFMVVTVDNGWKWKQLE